MAQPAWVVRTRRGRTRHGAQTGRPSGRSAFARLHERWAIRVLTVLYPLAFLPPIATRASRDARAVLDGTWPAAPGPAFNSVRRVRVAFPKRRLSLRLAAHLATLLIVVMAVVNARSAVFVAGSGDVVVGIRRVVPASADLRVQRSLGPGGRLASPDIALPALVAPREQLASPFSDSHVLLEGETLGQVAATYGVTAESLFWSNDLASGSVFAAGQELRIPRIAGVPHVIEEGDTLESIAARYGVKPEALLLLKANGLSDNAPLPVGREIFVPGGVLAYPQDLLTKYGSAQAVADMRAVAAGVVREADTNLREGPGRDYARLGTLDAGRRLKLIARHGEWVKVEDSSGKAGWVRGDLLGLSDEATAGLPETNDFPAPPVVWIWPTKGDISSTFGWRRIPYRSFHDGLDIANRAGTKIYAARAGRVFEAGWCSGFGYCVKIDHGDGLTTIYGHMLKRPIVRSGESVAAGDLIGLMGSTYDARGGGYSTGVHLHFTVKLNGKAVNPLKFLP
jgi:murein DD-endopeptidase MepM/ murein hydrolase activator NlpD